MKNNISVLLAIFIFGWANAQQPAMDAEMTDGGKGFYCGDAILTGAVGFSQTSFDNEKNISIEFSPSAAYFVSNHFAMGIAAGCRFTSFDDGDEVGSNATDLRISLGSLVRYYRSPMKKFSFFGEVGFMYNTTTFNGGAVDEADSKTNGFEVALSPGFSYFISKNFALEASIGLFKTESVKTDADDVPSKYVHTSRFDLSDLMIGLVYKL